MAMTDPLAQPARFVGAVTPQLTGPDALPVGESALIRALTAHGSDAGALAAADLLNKVEAQLRAAAPPGMPLTALRDAAERLVAEQGLQARLQQSGRSSVFAEMTSHDPAVDTRL
jgi:hypothetical protein